MTFTYPRSDLDRSRTLLGQLGSIWTDGYADRDFSLAMTDMQSQMALQTVSDLDEAAAAVAWATIPVWHRENYWGWTIYESDVTLTNDGQFSLPLPSGLVEVPVLTDRILDPTVSLSSDIDFLLTDSTVLFRQDPFAVFSSDPVFSGGLVADRTMTLWLFRPSFDREAVYRYLGYVLGVYAASGEAYKQLAIQLADAIACGTSRSHVERIVSIIYDIPIVKEDGETVEEITNDGRYNWVVTDRNAYRIPMASVLAVAQGSVLLKNQPLTTAYEWVWPRRDLSATTPHLTLSAGVLSDGFSGSLVAKNAEYVPTVTGAAGAEKVTFPLTGDSADITLFWDTVYTNGLPPAQSLYSLLVGMGGVPATINPMGFILQNLLRNNGVMIRVDSTQSGPDALNMNAAALLKKIMPPKTLLLIEDSPAS
jgi:voltage-gated potassium channel Kch